MNINCDRLIKAIDAYIEKVDDELEEALDAAGFIDVEYTVKEISGLEGRVARTLKRETKMILESMEDSVDLEAFARDKWPDVKLNDDIAEKLCPIFLEEFTALMPQLASHYVAEIDNELAVNQMTERTTAWIEDWSKELSSVMQLNSHEEIEAILSTSLAEGQSIAECTQAILDSDIRDEYYKARRVAVTEVLRAHSVAQHESFVQNPAIEEKMWRHTGSHKNEPRQNHVDMDGRTVPKDEPFELTGADGNIYYPMFPRDSILPPGEAVNCHCIEQPIVSEEVLGLPFEERQRLQAEAIADDDDEWEKELDAKNRAKAGIE